ASVICYRLVQEEPERIYTLAEPKLQTVRYVKNNLLTRIAVRDSAGVRRWDFVYPDKPRPITDYFDFEQITTSKKRFLNLESLSEAIEVKDRAISK
ncbi:MAG: hypothetical protein AAF483_21275, partial [Planctomycetota bacterium]